MDVIELKHHYESLSDDEIMRVLADRDGLTEIAASILKDEIARRGLEGEPFEARTAELKRELWKNKQRFERHQKRIARRAIGFVLALAILIIIGIVKALRK